MMVALEADTEVCPSFFWRRSRTTRPVKDLGSWHTHALVVCLTGSTPW